VNPRLVTCAALAAVAAASVAPAHAATKKKVTRGTYTVTANPNPTIEVTEEVSDSCDQTVPGGADNHVLTVPGKGTLKVVLQGEDPTKGAAPVGPDWDLFILDSDGSQYDSSTGGGALESTTDKFKKKQKITIQACNLLGTPNATVSWTFTPA
jgi:hypothetical protein